MAIKLGQCEHWGPSNELCYFEIKGGGNLAVFFVLFISTAPGLFGVADPPVLAGCQFHVSVRCLNK